MLPFQANDAIEQTLRAEHGRVLGSLIAMLDDFDLAEDVLQDALLTALERWPVDGRGPTQGHRPAASRPGPAAPASHAGGRNGACRPGPARRGRCGRAYLSRRAPQADFYLLSPGPGARGADCARSEEHT